MTKIFYDHLTQISEVTDKLNRHKISVEEREELIQLVDENIHHRVLNVILKNLPKEKHEEFLIKFHHKPHDPGLLDYLMQEIGDIEKIITAEANQVKKEILACIKKSIS